jgi:DNA-binding MarR family transcriptional regulator
MKTSASSVRSDRAENKKTSSYADLAPATELKVLYYLDKLEKAKKPTHGPAIARASDGAISVASIYKLLDRLAARGLVERAEVDVSLGDITVKRVQYRTIRSTH